MRKILFRSLFEDDEPFPKWIAGYTNYNKTDPCYMNFHCEACPFESDNKDRDCAVIEVRYIK